MAVKDIYIPYEEFCKQVLAVEDCVIGQVFKRFFMNPEISDIMKDFYFMRYPFDRSYFEYCASKPLWTHQVDIAKDVIDQYVGAKYAIDQYMDEEVVIDIDTKVPYDKSTMIIEDALAEDEQSDNVYNFAIRTPIIQSEKDLELNDEDVDRNVIIFKIPNDGMFAKTLPVVIRDFTFIDFYASRIEPFITSSITKIRYSKELDLPVVINHDRDAAYTVTKDTRVIAMLDVDTELIKRGMTRLYGIYLTDTKNELQCVGHCKEHEINAILKRINDDLASGNSTVYAFPWDRH